MAELILLMVQSIDDYKTAPHPEVTVFTFGSPRVGNIPFAEDYGAPRFAKHHA